MTLEQIREAVNQVLNDMNAAEYHLSSQEAEWRAAGDTYAIEALKTFISGCEVLELWYLSFLPHGQHL